MMEPAAIERLNKENARFKVQSLLYADVDTDGIAHHFHTIREINRDDEIVESLFMSGIRSTEFGYIEIISAGSPITSNFVRNLKILNMLGAPTPIIVIDNTEKKTARE